MLAEKLIGGLGKSQNHHRCLCPKPSAWTGSPAPKSSCFLLPPWLHVGLDPYSLHMVCCSFHLHHLLEPLNGSSHSSPGIEDPLPLHGCLHLSGFLCEQLLPPALAKEPRVAFSPPYGLQVQ